MQANDEQHTPTSWCSFLIPQGRELIREVSQEDHERLGNRIKA